MIKQTISAVLMSAMLLTFSMPLFAQRPAVNKPRLSSPQAFAKFAGLSAKSDGDGVAVRWTMASESNNLIFNVRRSYDTSDAIVSKSPVLSASTRYRDGKAAGEEYSYFDPTGGVGAVYWIEAVSLDGRKSVSDPFTVQPVLDMASSDDDVAGLRQAAAAAAVNSSVSSNDPELPLDLAREAAANALQPDPTAQGMVASSPGVRIGVKSEGFYRVTRAQLEAGGFNVASDPSKWQLYRLGVEQAIIVAPGGDYIEFYGKGIDTPESDSATYFLIEGATAGKRIGTRVARPSHGTVVSKNFASTFFYKPRTNYVSTIMNGDAENYWGPVVTSTAATQVTFNLPGVDQNGSEAVVTISLMGFSFAEHMVNVTLNSTPLSPIQGAYRTGYQRQYSVPAAALVSGTNTLTMQSVGSGDISFFDAIKIEYKRQFTAVQDQLSFYTSNYRRTPITGFSSANVRVFDVTFDGEPFLLDGLTFTQGANGFGTEIPAYRGRQMFALTDSAVKQPASITLNADRSLLKSEDNVGKFVVVTHSGWATEAAAWAAYRQGQGTPSKVIDVRDIYDEFNYGDISSVALRDFFTHAKANWSTKPEYILLLGDASYDGRNYEGFGNFNFIPSHMVDTVYTTTGSDDYLTDSNGDGLAEIPIGRVPARSGAEVTNAFTKTKSFEASMPTMQSRGGLFTYDCYDANNNYDFLAISQRIRDQIPTNVPVDMIGRCDPSNPDSPMTRVINSINSGKYFANYAGHGTTGVWGNVAPFLLTNTQVPQLTNANNLTIFTMLTCLNGFFMMPNKDSLAELVLRSTTGGAVVAWASTGETEPQPQEAMAKRFYNQLSFGSMDRMGDLVNDAKAQVQGGSDVRLSWALLGDPMLKVK